MESPCTASFEPSRIATIYLEESIRVLRSNEYQLPSDAQLLADVLSTLVPQLRCLSVHRKAFRS